MKKSSIILFFAIFEIIAILLFITLNNTFYLLNFTYIGTCLSIGLYLYSTDNKYSKYSRNFIQLSIGLYMLVYLGIISGENMMIEGFWYYLFLGVFEAAVIHYLVAKILGPFLFGRGWCGYACWTAMILDLLPYKTPNKNLDHKRKNYGFIRYVLFIISLIGVGLIFIMNVPNLSRVMFYLFIAGNIIYYMAGIILAYALKDNRAFCKYVCPTTVFLKIGARYSLLKIKYKRENCIYCNKCYRVCPMDVDICKDDKNKKNGTECILCLNCTKACGNDALFL